MLTAAQLIRPGEERWDSARAAWSLAIDQRPAVVEQPHDADAVAAVVNFARENQLLCIYSVEPGTPSHDAMRLLATWAATQDAEAAHASIRDVDDRASPMA